MTRRRRPTPADAALDAVLRGDALAVAYVADDDSPSAAGATAGSNLWQSALDAGARTLRVVEVR